MSLTLSLTPRNPFLDHSYSSRSNTISTTSAGTTRHHGADFKCRITAEVTNGRKAHTPRPTYPKAHTAMSSEDSFSTIPLDSPHTLFRDFSGQHSARCSPTPRLLVEDGDSSSLQDDLVEEQEHSAFVETDSLIAPSGRLPAFDPTPFRRWLSKLRRRAQSGDSISGMPRRRRGKSSSHSSSAFVTGVREATISLAETSLAPMSWLTDRRGYGRGSQHARFSSDNDSAVVFYPMMDELAQSRAVQRCRVLHELVTTEEGYVADLKALINVSTRNGTCSAAHLSSSRSSFTLRCLHLLANCQPKQSSW